MGPKAAFGGLALGRAYPELLNHWIVSSIWLFDFL
jgi:hypothetical protein